MECSMDKHDLDHWLSILSLFFDFYFDHGRKSPYSTCVSGDTPLDSYAGYYKWAIRPVVCFYGLLTFSDFSVNTHTQPYNSTIDPSRASSCTIQYYIQRYLTVCHYVRPRNVTCSIPTMFWILITFKDNVFMYWAIKSVNIPAITINKSTCNLL